MNVLTPLLADRAIQMVDVLVTSVGLAALETDVCSVTHFLCNVNLSGARQRVRCNVLILR